jgi:hypothetical protein
MLIAAEESHACFQKMIQLKSKLLAKVTSV